MEIDRFHEWGALLEGLGLSLNFPTSKLSESDDVVEGELQHPHGAAAYSLAILPALTLSALQKHLPHSAFIEKLLVFGPLISKRSADSFRQHGINYLDTAGNALITFPGVHIDIQGRAPAHTSVSLGATHPAPRQANLFSPKRSRVIFSGLITPGHFQRPFRELANLSGVSVGLAQDTTKLLQEHNFLNIDREFAPMQYENLSEMWAREYPGNLGSRSRTQNFSGEINDIKSTPETIYVSGESASPVIKHPQTLTLYSDELPTALIIRNRWRRDDHHPNIFIRSKFWDSNDSGHTNPDTTPWLLIYADLLASNESRQSEAAREIWRRNVQPI